MTNADEWPTDAGSLEKFGRRADTVYDECVKPKLTMADEGKFVALDVDSGTYEIDADDLAAEDRLLDRRPGAAVWLTRVGSRYAHRLGHAIEIA